MSETRWSIQSVPLGHEINADAVTFRRNAKLSGNALSQLTDAITLWAERRGMPPAGQKGALPDARQRAVCDVIYVLEMLYSEQLSESVRGAITGCVNVLRGEVLAPPAAAPAAPWAWAVVDPQCRLRDRQGNRADYLVFFHAEDARLHADDCVLEEGDEPGRVVPLFPAAAPPRERGRARRQANQTHMSDRLSDEPLDTLARRVISAYEDGAAVEVAKEYLALRQRLAAVEAGWREEAEKIRRGADYMSRVDQQTRMKSSAATLSEAADTLKAALENRE